MQPKIIYFYNSENFGHVFFSILTVEMQFETEKTLRNLSVLGALMQNDKINTEGEIFSIYVPTISRGLVRKFYGENRETNVTHIQEAVRHAKTFVSQTLSTQRPLADSFNSKMFCNTQIQHSTRMIEAMNKAIKGLTHLIQTYRDDASISAKLDIICNEIQDFVNNIESIQEGQHLAILQ